MPIVELSDEDINKLIQLQKNLPDNYTKRLKAKMPKYSGSHEESQLELNCSTGGTFKIIIRKNIINPFDFSVILGYVPQERIKLLRIRRYNGNSHIHTNNIEQTSFRNYHIHLATQRYQEAGWEIDKYAEITDKYTDVEGALDALINDCNFIRPIDETSQKRLL